MNGSGRVTPNLGAWNTRKLSFIGRRFYRVQKWKRRSGRICHAIRLRRTAVYDFCNECLLVCFLIGSRSAAVKKRKIPATYTHSSTHKHTHAKPAKRGKMATWASPSEPVTSPTTSIPEAERAAEALTLVVVLQMTLLVVISVTGTFANALVFAVFYRRPSLRTISNR
jgi:hypothetical protein